MLIAVILGATLRLSMFLFPKSLWGDEMYSLWYVENLDKTLTLNHPPLYYWVISFIPNLVYMRLFSVLCGVATVVFTYFISKHLFPKAGSVAALLVAISPYFIQPSFEVRSYALVGMLSSAVILAYLKKSWIALVILCAVLPWVEHIGILLVVGLVILICNEDRDARNYFPGIIGLLLFPYFLLLYFQLTNDENPSDPTKWIYLTNPLLYVKKLVGLLVHINVGYRYSMMTVENIPWREWWFYVLAVTACLMAYYAVLGFRRCAHPIKWLIFAPLPLFFYPTKLHARYLIEIAPLYYCLVAGGLCRR